MAPRRLCCDRRAALPDAGNIAVEVFKRERQLIGIEAFGATPELRPLQLLDDDLEPLDLAVAALDNSGHVAHQTVQQSRIGRQIFEVEPHVQFYSNMLIRRSKFAIFYAGFCNIFSRQERASICVPARASRCPRSASRAAPATA